MNYTSKTPKIGALFIAFETATQNAATEEIKEEIQNAFKSTLEYILPFKLVGVIYEGDGSVKVGIFQTSTARDQWLKTAKRKKLKTEKGNGYNLQPNYQNRFDINYEGVAGREISDDLTSIVFNISR